MGSKKEIFDEAGHLRRSKAVGFNGGTSSLANKSHSRECKGEALSRQRWEQYVSSQPEHW